MPGGIEIADRTVLVGDDRWLTRPLNRKAGVVPADSALTLGRVKLIDEVESLNIVRQGNEAVREALMAATLQWLAERQ